MAALDPGWRHPLRPLKALRKVGAMDKSSSNEACSGVSGRGAVAQTWASARPSGLSFDSLPPLVLATITSFLEAACADRLAATCRWALTSPHICQPRRTLQQHASRSHRDVGSHAWWQSRMALLRLFSRAGVVAAREMEVSLSHYSLLDPVCEVLRLGHGRRVKSLAVGVCADTAATEEEGRLLGHAMEEGCLPLLRRLELCYASGQWESVWHALRQGACPHLEGLRIDCCSPAQLTALTDALEARHAEQHPCSTLRDLAIHAFDGASDSTFRGEVATLLRASSLSGLSCLYVTVTGISDVCLAHLSAFLRSSGAPALRRLQLDGRVKDEVDGNALSTALAEGAAPQLERLNLQWVQWTGEGVLSLAASLKAGVALRHLKELRLSKVLQHDTDLWALASAAAEGHGFPCLERLFINPGGDGGERMWTALSPLFRKGLPRLKSLEVWGPFTQDMGAWVSALRERPSSSVPLERLEVLFLDTHGLACLSEALLTPPLRQLKDLSVWYRACAGEMQQQQQPLAPLVAALRSQAGSQLTRLTLHECGGVGRAGVEELLEAVAAGACPKLSRLVLDTERPAVLSSVEALECLLSGGASCSPCLRAVIFPSFSCGQEGFERLAAAVARGRAVQLEHLCLSSQHEGEEDLTGLLRFIDALGCHAGSRLESFVIEMDGAVQAEVVVEKVARGLADGLALGRFPVLQYASVESGGVDAGKQLIQDMLEGRRRRREGQQL